MASGDSDKRSFWDSLPEILKEIAAVIVAIGGLLTILYSSGIIDGDIPAGSQGDLPILEQFDSNPSQIEMNGGSTVSWTVSGARRVAIEPSIGGVPSAGTRYVSPSENTTYTLIAENDVGRVNATVEVLIVPNDIAPNIISK